MENHIPVCVPDALAVVGPKPKRRRAPKMRKRFLRDTLIMKACLPKEQGGEGLSALQAAKRYGLSRIAVYKILQKPDVKAMEQEWLQDMFSAHRGMGQDAIAATHALIKQKEPRTVSDFWHRMGVTREPSVDMNIEKLEINAPPDFLKAIKEVAGGSGE